MTSEAAGRVRRRRSRVAGLLGALLLFLMVPGAQTSAAWTDVARMTATGATTFWLPWYGQLRLDSTTWCLDVPSRTDSPGQSLQSYVCNSTPAQIWSFETDGRVRVFTKGQNAAGDGAPVLCLQYNGVGRGVTIETCRTNRTNQQWTVVRTANGALIRSVNTTTQCLLVASSTQTQSVASTGTCTAGPLNVWDLEYVATISYA